MSLLAEDNLCGQTLLRLSASGASIIGELLRLARNIPEVLQHPSKSAEAAQYAEVLFDFEYLKNQEEFERKLNASMNLLDLDQEMFDSYGPIFMRFYTLFESIVTYLDDYKEFLDHLASGVFIQYTTDNVLQDTDGKQLMCECLYLYGTMLLFLERHIPGPTREKVVIAVRRHQAEASLEKLETVSKLIRSTGYHPDYPDKRPKNYPESFFSRFAVPEGMVRMLVQTLQSDDIYRQDRAFPSPEHRSTRLATQAGMLYVILYFAPKVLHNSEASMRETVDKHFSENWIITIYMGHVVDLSVSWQGYRAAKKALDNIMTVESIRRASEQNIQWFSEAKQELSQFLTDGVLNEQFLLLNMHQLLECMRKSNAALRWRLLHRRAWQPKLAAFIGKQLSANQVMDLLLQSAQLEFDVKAMFNALLDGKQQRWDEAKGQCVGRLRELSEYFTGDKALTRVKRDERMLQWFARLAQEVEQMDEGEQHATVMGRKLQKTIGALEEVEQFEQIDNNPQIKVFLSDTREVIRGMIRVVNIRHADLSKMEVITDLSYAFELLDDYTSVIHERVRSEPSYSVLLRAGFVKLSSILDVPLTRINQIDSPDAISVAEFYSGELVDFMRRILDVIPRSVFSILKQIISVQTSKLKPLPVKLESQYLKDYAQLDERYHLAQMTHRASTFTEGVLAMEQTSLGIIKVDARQILHDGLRKELVRQVSEAMHQSIAFNPQHDISVEFEGVMGKLGTQMDGFRRSIEYIQDYVDMAGLKMWQEEVARIMNYNIEQECNRYLKKKVLEHSSRYQSKVIPIPRFAQLPASAGPVNTRAVNFTGRVMNALLAMTDPASTVFSPEAIGWYRNDGTTSCGLKSFGLLHRGVSATGLRGLDRLLAFRIAHELGYFLSVHRDTVSHHLAILEGIRDALYPEHQVPSNATKLYGGWVKKFEKLMPKMLQAVQKVGQAQLLRRQLSYVLQFSCRLDANLLYQALTTMNTAVLNDVREHYRTPETKPYPKEKNPLLAHLNKLLEASGMSDPLAKIYIVSEPVEGLPVMLFLFIVTYMSKLQYDQDFATLVRRKPAFGIDGMPFIVGLWTLLKQFHPSYTRQVLAYIGQFARATVQAAMKTTDGKPGTIPTETTNCLIFVDLFCKVGQISRAALSEFIPQYIFDAAAAASSS